MIVGTLETPAVPLILFCDVIHLQPRWREILGN